MNLILYFSHEGRNQGFRPKACLCQLTKFLVPVITAAAVVALPTVLEQPILSLVFTMNCVDGVQASDESADFPPKISNYLHHNTSDTHDSTARTRFVWRGWSPTTSSSCASHVTPYLDIELLKYPPCLYLMFLV